MSLTGEPCGQARDRAVAADGRAVLRGRSDPGSTRTLGNVGAPAAPQK